MARATLNWDLPTERENGAALTPADISHTEISMSADAGDNFSPSANVASDVTQEFVVDDLAPGDYIFRAVVVDAGLRRSDSVEIPGSVLTPPLGVQNFAVTIE